MATVIKLCRTSHAARYLALIDTAGVISCELIIGDASSLSGAINDIINPPTPDFLLMEDSDKILQENTSKIIIE